MYHIRHVLSCSQSVSVWRVDSVSIPWSCGMPCALRRLTMAWPVWSCGYY